MENRWYSVEKEWRGSCPPLHTYEMVLGHDPQGREWRARSKYRVQDDTFMVWFDHMEGDMPFLRDEVVYADSYWKAMRKRYGMKTCAYKDIMSVVNEFAFANEII